MRIELGKGARLLPGANLQEWVARRLNILASFAVPRKTVAVRARAPTAATEDLREGGRGMLLTPRDRETTASEAGLCPRVVVAHGLGIWSVGVGGGGHVGKFSDFLYELVLFCLRLSTTFGHLFGEMLNAGTTSFLEVIQSECVTSSVSCSSFFARLSSLA